MKVKDFVFETFLRLTSKTCPHGYEERFMSEFGKLFPKGLQTDEWGNYFIKIGNSRTIFAAHIDTVSKEYLKVTHVINKNSISTDGKTTLGADDKAGVTVMLWMIQNNVPGLYYFFIGEEVGCIGSGKASQLGKFKGDYDKIISFDRRGTNSVITHQSSTRCCSEEFGTSLAKELTQLGLDYETDDGGVYTDSAEFMDIIPECTNVSVGYYKEHTVGEYQDINHLTLLAEACVKVDWENLPVKRDPSVKEYKDWGYSSYGRSSYGCHDDWYDKPKKKRKRSRRGGGYGKKYYSYSDDLHELDSEMYLDSESVYVSDYIGSSADAKYDWLISKFTNSNLTLNELDLISEQYLDMNSDYDRYFYEYLIEQHYEKNGLDS